MKKSVIISFVLLFCILARGQKTEVSTRDYFEDAEFFLENEEYADALYDYLELYNRGYENNSNINYRIGSCYLNIKGQKEKAIPYLLKAVENTTKRYQESVLRETRAPIDAFLYLGNAYRVTDQLEKAIATYNQYIKLAADFDESGIEYAKQQIEACLIAKDFMETPVEFEKRNLGPEINTSSSNYKGVISGDGNTLLYMMELPFYHAVYFSQNVNGEWTAPVNITPQIQSDGDQFVTSVSYDGKQLFLTKEDNFNSDIYISNYENGLWTKSVPLSNKINTKFWESHASISADGKTLYFSSNRRGGLGEMDIYKSELNEFNDWSAPVNLGNNINTELNEDTPFITEDGKTLYFSSQSHKSMGGYDIFISHKDEQGNWSGPENLGYPINSTDDDLFFYPWKNGNVGLVSVFSDDGFGKEDLYEYWFVPFTAFEEEIALKVGEDVEEEMTQQEIADTIPADMAEAKTEEPVAKDTISEIAKIEFDLEPVYFGFDSYLLREENIRIMEKLIVLLKNNKEFQVVITGHTDALGEAVYNLRLSERRAKSALDYLVKHGIKIERLTSKGMGENQFAAINVNPDGSDNPEGRKLNRRVEFELIGVNQDKIIIKIKPIPEELRYKE
ncbi:MAG: PD40 domain-containing protein [Bacteroidales bacterium]|nr:PD40 domain-containing protein [Bacteroidales bacterium]